MTYFTGAPSAASDCSSLGHAGATNVSTTINPSEPCSTTTLPPGPESRVSWSPSRCVWIGTAPICARKAAVRSCRLLPCPAGQHAGNQRIHERPCAQRRHCSEPLASRADRHGPPLGEAAAGEAAAGEAAALRLKRRLALLVHKFHH